MNALRRFSHEVKQLMLISNKQNFQPLIVSYSIKGSSDRDIYRVNTMNVNNYQNFLKHNFHTSSNNRDLETGFKCIGAGMAMVGALGPGIGIGMVFGNLLNAAARNPSIKEQLFPLAIAGAVFCEVISLFCLMIGVIAIYG